MATDLSTVRKFLSSLHREITQDEAKREEKEKEENISYKKANGSKKKVKKRRSVAVEKDPQTGDNDEDNNGLRNKGGADNDWHLSLRANVLVSQDRLTAAAVYPGKDLLLVR